MTSVNSNFLKLQSNYLFAEIARKVASFKEANPEKRVISLGIGDVTRPLVPAVVAALHKAVDDMGDAPPSTATARSRATPFCAKPLPSTTTRHAVLT